MTKVPAPIAAGCTEPRAGMRDLSSLWVVESAFDDAIAATIELVRIH